MTCKIIKMSPLVTDLCTHVRQELYDILGVGQLIRCFLLQEGEAAIKTNNVQMLMFTRKKTLHFFM